MNVEISYKNQQPFLLETIKWFKMTDDIYYARFALKDHKYVYYQKSLDYKNSKTYFTFSCTPIIYDENSNLLRETNYVNYFNHTNFWTASLSFEYPENITRFNAITVNDLKWEYEIWFTKIDINRFLNLYDQSTPPQIALNNSNKDKNGY